MNDRYISNKKELSEKLKYIRHLNGLSQLKVAEHLNVDRSTYSYYETAKTTPDIFTLIKLSSFYKIDIAYFIRNQKKQYLKQKAV